MKAQLHAAIKSDAETAQLMKRTAMAIAPTARDDTQAHSLQADRKGGEEGGFQKTG